MAREATDFTRMSQRELYFSFSLVTSLFFLWGFSYGLLDVLNQHFLDIFNLTKTQTTLLQFAYFVAYLVVAPGAGAFMRRTSYKLGIHCGLGLFSIGAIMFWPAAHYGYYGMFVAFTFVTASGLATLEVAANSYITVLGTPKFSALRLTLAQGFNGIATVIGPIIAAHAFFNGANKYSLGTVQYVYLAMSLFGCVINVLVFFAKLPDVQQVVTVVSGVVGEEKATVKGLFRFRRTIFGFIAEFAYVGAQVAVASFAIFYITEQPGISPPISQATASNMFSGCQAVFTAGRFIGVLYLKYVDPAFALFASGLGLMLFSILTAVLPGKGGIACLYMIFFFESICYPVIFSVATADLGTYAKLGAGLIAAGVSGGACWPSMTGAVADRHSTHIAFFIPFMGYVPLAVYGLVMWVSRSRKYTGKITIWVSQAPLVVPDAVEKALGVPEGEDIEMPTIEENKEEVSHVEFR
ncbi:major facilitator superfamily domain-containing protein [Naematelia encephala]|uniref:Major facilitator superfamily domain-containing protein n=1 Tax=Naematelia encephala TaxID=71784 RepID=A0A1Y2BB15_9TREE|nr:major facilitator superfamily domain-containing protein [Naematelia encephala]